MTKLFRSLSSKDESSFVASSASSDGANTIIHRERQRQRTGTPATKSTSSVGCFSCGRDDSLVLEPHFTNNMDNVVIIGAEAIGGFVGCCLYQGGGYAQVTFLVRNPSHIERYSIVGYTAHSTVDRDFRACIPPKDIRRVFTTDASILTEASCIFVATRRSANENIHRLLCQHDVTCPVVFLQNGMKIREDLEATTCGRTGKYLDVEYEVIEAIVMMSVGFNKASGIVTLGQSLKDALVVLDGRQRSAQNVCDLFDGTALTVYAERKHDFVSLQAAKVQVTMLNAINALSGVTVAETLRQPGYRLVLAYCIDECREVFAAHRIPLQAVGNKMSNFRLMMMSTFMRTWNIVFLPVMGSKMGLLQCKCSMAQDLENGVRATEIDYLNGVVVQLGRLAGIMTPVNRRIVELVKEAEEAQQGSPKLSPQALMIEVGLAAAKVPASSQMPEGPSPDEDPRDLVMSFDNQQQEQQQQENEAALSITSDNSYASVGQRVRTTLALAMLSSEELSQFAVGSLPPSPTRRPSQKRAASPRKLDRSAEMVMSFDRSIGLWS